MEEKVGIVGAGKLGGSLARALCEAGVKVVAITDIVLERASAKVRMCGDETCAVPVADLPNDLTMVLITVSDDAIAEVAGILASTDKINKKCVVAHSSGALSSMVLSSLRRKTKLLASFHPIQTFSGSEDDWQRLFGIYFSLEGHQQALPRLRTLVDKLRSREFEIPADKKELYHLSCVMASNFLVVLQAAATQVMSNLSINEKRAFALLEPLIYATLDNIKIMGHVGALTGPIVRRDIGTIERHLKALDEFYPDLVSLYSSMSLLSVTLLRNKEGNGDDSLVEIEKKLENFRSTSPNLR